MELEKLKQIIAEILKVDPNEISEETTFICDLGADSLDIFQIIIRVEEELGIDIPKEKVEYLRTVKEAVQLIKKSNGVTE